MTEAKKSLFSGEWLYDEATGKYKAYEGVVAPDGWWSGGVQWLATHDVAKALVADQNALVDDIPEAGRLTIVTDLDGDPVALVTYEPADGEFYTQHFNHDNLVQVPSWTWHTVDEADTSEVVR